VEHLPDLPKEEGGRRSRRIGRVSASLLVWKKVYAWENIYSKVAHRWQVTSALCKRYGFHGGYLKLISLFVNLH
jgi:hypothetical protein